MKKLIPFLLLLFLTACDKSEEVSSFNPDIPFITGFELRDLYGNILGQEGTPNIQTRIIRNNQRFEIIAYPNPTTGRILVQYSESSQALGAARRIWLTAATTDQLQPQYQFAGSNMAIIGGNPIVKIDNVEPIRGRLSLDLSGLPDGAYRLYAQFDDVLLWDNILIKK